MIRFIVLTLVAAISATGAQAQSIVRVLDGRSSNPVPSALVRFPDLDRSFVTSSDGTVTVPYDSGRVVVSALGYEEAEAVLESSPLTIRLTPRALELDSLTVSVDGGRLEAGASIFSRRREENRGVFLDPADVQTRIQFRSTDVFYDVEGVRGSLSPSGERIPISTLGTGCFNYLVNKLEARVDPQSRDPWSEWPLSAIHPGDIMAVEIYRYLGEVPAELQRFAGRTDPPCGLVVIWTKEAWLPPRDGG